MSEKFTETIGIIGGGQLGRMLTQAALPLGFRVQVLETNTMDSPVAQVGAIPYEGSTKDSEDVRKFVRVNDVTTWEVEHIDADTLAEMRWSGHDIQSDPATLVKLQDKFEQKRELRALNFPVGDFMDHNEVGVGDKWSCAIVKAKYGGFDGRGNYRLEEGESLWSRGLDQKIVQKFGSVSAVYAEALVDFDRELSVIAARDRQGSVVTYPVVETIQQDGICHTVISPARIGSRLTKAADDLARGVMESYLNEGETSAGVFAIEMFAIGDDVLINEIAPRVHNSGHLTIDAHQTSQFEQHIRAVTGLPLGSTEQRALAAVMVNILGNIERAGLERVISLPDTHVHLYGKSPRKNRKIGHVTTLAADMTDALANAKQIQSYLVDA